MRSSPDLAVVGGGPAGLATAIRGRLAGLSVVLFEQLEPPIDKACGEGLMPDGVASLMSMGVEVMSLGRPFTGITYIVEGTAAVGSFPTGSGLGIRRTRLHAALVDRALSLGVDLRFGCPVRRLEDSRVVTPSGSFEAGWIVGADGLHSRVRRWLGISRRHGRPRFGVRRHFRIEPWSDSVEVVWGDGCEAYVTPVSDDLVGVAMLSSGPAAGFDSLLERFPDLSARLADAPVASKDRGSGPFWSLPESVTKGRAALVGDAAGYIDAIAGEGLSLAFHQAEAVVEAVVAGRLETYRVSAAQLARWPGLMTRALLAIEQRRWLQKRLVGTLARDPQLFSRLLGVHSRQLSPADLGIGSALRLARGLAFGTG